MHFDSHAMTVSLTPKKLTEVRTLVIDWSAKQSATLHELWSLLGKLLYIAQVCALACLFLNRMLETLRQCPVRGSFSLSPEFHKDVAWFRSYLPTSDGVVMIHRDDRTPKNLYVRSCQFGCGAITTNHAYHVSHSSPQQNSFDMSPGGLKCSRSIEDLGPPLFSSAIASVLR